ncbi:sulfite exporter TauE/SafE family protein [Motiliproteus sp. SC1-56]|uniref:sulfite exporter TauE/SafE family protein n=1 Tax=Motiliproteus sp. SC1-56 TaxID=2799565 RepID=UPI001A90B254|nr:sulfite exporter TauE/SafE family protein [Motiliproteus sp. SC1-56]
MPEIWMPYVSAFLVGLVGGVHCLGMCGGIVSALSFGMPRETQGQTFTLLLFHSAYNLGRILSYVAAGALMGGLGVLLVESLPMQTAQQLLLAMAGLFMILLGLYMGGWWMVLNRVESLGRHLWRRIEPLGRQLMPIRSPGRALAVGALWGWLPCGLVYSMLINAVASGGAAEGALLMLAFALGTLPNLLVMGTLVGVASHLFHNPGVRKGAALLVIGFGLYTLGRLL